MSLKRILRKHVWAVVAGLLVLLGAFGSVLAANAVGHNAAINSKKGLIATSQEIASTLELSIGHEQDLVVSTDAFIANNPAITEAQFLHWMASTSAFERYPELSGMSEIEMVPASQLSAFAVQETRDPPGPLASNGTYQVTPPGIRPYYCLESVAQQRSPKAILPAGFDYCETPIAPHILKARDSGQSLYLPYKIGKTESLALGRATYVNGTVPPTLEERRVEVRWAHRDCDYAGCPSLRGSGGSPKHRRVLPLCRWHFHGELHGRIGGFGRGKGQRQFAQWLDSRDARVCPARRPLQQPKRQSHPARGHRTQPVVGALALVLGTGRSRAREKLELRTAELQFLALHDPLTMLPNRALIVDRIEQMVARCRRTDLPCAVMFLDLDDFKDINDTLGHAVGDQVFTAVAVAVEGCVTRRRHRRSPGRR